MGLYHHLLSLLLYSEPEVRKTKISSAVHKPNFYANLLQKLQMLNNPTEKVLGLSW